MKHIKTWSERCEERPDHQWRIITERMIQARMQEEIDDLRQALIMFQQPTKILGWVKIDEVRQHFESVGCGTIYKTFGEDRVPLYTAPQKKQWVGLHGSEVPDPYKYDVMFNEGWWWAEEKLKEKNT